MLDGLIGRKVSHYRVLKIIGAGGMGTVYEAEDLKLGRSVALKFLPEDMTSDAVAAGDGTFKTCSLFSKCTN